jgi:hypothetical protein
MKTVEELHDRIRNLQSPHDNHHHTLHAQHYTHGPPSAHGSFTGLHGHGHKPSHKHHVHHDERASHPVWVRFVCLVISDIRIALTHTHTHRYTMYS